MTFLQNNWYEAFSGHRVGERPIQVEMAFWDDMEVTSFDDSGAVVAAHASPRPIPGTSMERSRTFQVRGDATEEAADVLQF